MQENDREVGRQRGTPHTRGGNPPKEKRKRKNDGQEFVPVTWLELGMRYIKILVALIAITLLFLGAYGTFAAMWELGIGPPCGILAVLMAMAAALMLVSTDNV